ncbi:Uncharacterized protein GBIM_07712 [Gryllus bimaculatus]|nr:Uncharacterized protein GBIM_07712 [Gryllus bimaculatus]
MSESDIRPPPPPLLRQCILEDFKEPVVFQGLLSNWKFLSWDLQEWARVLGDKLMPFRSGVPQWERSCQTTHLTMKEFLELAEPKEISSGKNTSNWFYFDYKYMHQWFKENPDILQAVCWEDFGFPEQRGEQSTVWIGSDGAHTPCHFDTYGCNLVAQVYGMKQWILFPPKASASLLPTRVPYEESSVYSKHNFYSPDPHIANGLHKAWIITLKPGEVLFVPHHWWHYVENIGTAISINTWLPLPSDCESRLEECLVKLLVSQLSREVPDTEMIFNPNEDDASGCSLQENITLLETCMQQFFEQQLDREQLHTEGETPEPKRMKTVPCDSNDVWDRRTSISHYETFIQNVPTYSGDQLQNFLATKRANFKSFSSNNPELSSVTFTVEKVINALCHPDVISVAKTKLCQEFCGNNL